MDSVDDDLTAREADGYFGPCDPDRVSVLQVDVLRRQFICAVLERLEDHDWVLRRLWKYYFCAFHLSVCASRRKASMISLKSLASPLDVPPA